MIAAVSRDSGRMKTIIGIALILIISGAAFAKETIMPEKKVVYKTIDNTVLALHVFNPKGHKLTDKRPAIVFFFGGGWMGGNPKQFYQQAKSFAALGFVAMSAECRVIGKHKTTPFECAGWEVSCPLDPTTCSRIRR